LELKPSLIQELTAVFSAILYTSKVIIYIQVMQLVHLSVVWHQCLNHWANLCVKVKIGDFNKSCQTLLIFYRINTNNTSVFQPSVYHKALTFKQPTFTQQLHVTVHHNKFILYVQATRKFTAF